MSKKKLHYFSTEEIEKQEQFSKIRTNIFRPLSAALDRIGLKPDHVSYIGVVFLIISVITLKGSPIFGSVTMFLYIIMDGIDGSLARYQGTQNDGGALTDIIADQLGIVIIAGMMIYYNDSNPTVVYAYGILYVFMIAITLFQNSLEIKMYNIIRSKYVVFMYYCIISINTKYGIISISNDSLYMVTTYMLLGFTIIMVITSIRSYLQIKKYYNSK